MVELISPQSEPPAEIMSFGVSPVNYSDSERLFRNDGRVNSHSTGFYHFINFISGLKLTKCQATLGKVFWSFNLPRVLYL